MEHEKNLIRVFITANEKDCIAHIEETYGFNRKKAEEFIKKSNRDRSSYYNYYTNHDWGDSRNYDITLNRSTLGLDETVEVLASFVRKKLARIEKQEEARNE